MKIISWLLLITVLIYSVVISVDISNSQLAILLMILLLSLFSDLKEFDFWGLKGKKPRKTLNN